jgi:hypothetical protein
MFSMGFIKKKTLVYCLPLESPVQFHLITMVVSKKEALLAYKFQVCLASRIFNLDFTKQSCTDLAI